MPTPLRSTCAHGSSRGESKVLEERKLDLLTRGTSGLYFRVLDFKLSQDSF
jgi:hypothetical protein